MPKRTMTQKQLLEEAKKTEIMNLESLKTIVTMDLFSKSNKPKKMSNTNRIELKHPIIRLKSQILLMTEDERQQYQTLNTLSFENGISKRKNAFDNYFPSSEQASMLMSQTNKESADMSSKSKNVRYFDPLTGNYFYDINTFRKLRSQTNS